MNSCDCRTSRSSRIGFPVPLVTLFLTLLAALLSACGTLPQTRTTRHTIDYSKTLLASWEDGSAVFLIRECAAQDFEPHLPPVMSTIRCRLASHSVLAGPLELDVAEEVRDALREDSGDSTPTLRNSIPIPEPTFFDRPPSAKRTTDWRFVGVLGENMIWLSADSGRGDAGSPNAPARKLQLIDLGTPIDPARYPALVVREKQNIWMFADRPGACPEELCLSPSEVLAMDEMRLPETLRRKFLVLYADANAQRPSFSPVLPRELGQYLGEHSRPIPGPGAGPEWEFDLPEPTDVPPAAPWTRCRIDERFSMRVTYLYLIPFAEQTTGRAVLLRSCKPVAAERKIDAAILDAPLVRLQGHAPDGGERRTAVERSTYFCFRTPAADQPVEGGGPDGCGFVLRDPETDAPMPFTPYLLQMRPAAAGYDGLAELEVKGITDAEGRTAFVRSTSPLTRSRMRLVRRLVSPINLLVDDHGMPGSPPRRNTEPFPGPKEGVRLGYGLAYRMTSCSGLAFESMTDEEGWTAMFDPPVADNCPVIYSLRVGKSRARPVAPR